MPFAGAIQYREYGLITRAFVRAMAAHDGKPTDTTRNHDFTDWEAVESFGRHFARLVHPEPGGGTQQQGGAKAVALAGA